MPYYHLSQRESSRITPFRHPRRYYRTEASRLGGDIPPETRLIMGQIGGVLVPVGACVTKQKFLRGGGGETLIMLTLQLSGLYWLAFTSMPQVHWIVPILASIPFGAG